MNFDIQPEIIKKINLLQPIYKEKAKQFKTTRFLFDTLLEQVDLPHITGISGLRGTGKTVLLLQLLQKLENSFYISLDTIGQTDLFALAYTLKTKYHVKILLLDEIHYLPNWQNHLKQIYDILDIKVFFTSSVSLDILSAKEDLSRRVLIINLPVLNFREYLHLAKNIHIKAISLTKGLKTEYADPTLEGLFAEYLQYPLASQLRNKTSQLITNLIDKIITKDLVTKKSLTLNDQVLLQQTLRFLSQITGGDISVTQLANNLKVSKYKMVNLLKMLEQAFLIHLVYPSGKNVLKEPKVLLNLPFRVYLAEQSIDQITGTLKEDFIVTQFKALNIPIYYLKTKRGKKTPDFLVQLHKQTYIIEVGGKSKGYSQFKGITAKNKIVATYPFNQARKYKRNSTNPNLTIKNVPLYVFGLMY